MNRTKSHIQLPTHTCHALCTLYTQILQLMLLSSNPASGTQQQQTTYDFSESYSLTNKTNIFEIKRERKKFIWNLKLQNWIFHIWYINYVSIFPSGTSGDFLWNEMIAVLFWALNLFFCTIVSCTYQVKVLLGNKFHIHSMIFIFGLIHCHRICFLFSICRIS